MPKEIISAGIQTRTAWTIYHQIIREHEGTIFVECLQKIMASKVH